MSSIRLSLSTLFAFAFGACALAQGVPPPRMTCTYPPSDAKVVDGNGTAVPVVDGMALQSGYKIMNGGKTWFNVDIEGIGRVTLGWGATATINLSMAPPPAPRFWKTDINLEKGVVYANFTGLAANETAFKVTSPGVTTMTNGGTFAVELYRGVSTIVTGGGRVLVYLSSDKDDSATLISPGQVIVIDPRNAVGMPMKIDDPNHRRLLGDLRTLF